MNQFIEDTLVQETIAKYLEEKMGWGSIYAYNTEDFGPDSLLGRSSEREVVLKRSLRKKIVELNPNLPPEAYDEAIRKLTDSLASQAIVTINIEKHGLIRDGVQVRYKNKDGEIVKDRLRVIDFDNPENNEFLCVRELWIKGDLYNRRPDIIGFVNGLPLLFMECKNINRDLKVAFEGNYSDYRDTIPHLFHHNAIVMVGNGESGKMGSITSQWGHFQEWKRLDEDDAGVVDMETMLKGVCDKKHFIDLIENFIFFDDSSGAPRKIIAKNHQFLGVNKAFESVKDRKLSKGKLGVFWHTQGSGKSYSMVMLTRKVHRKIGGNFTFLMLTDRDDLDTQLYKTFAGCGIVDNDRDPCRPTNERHLKELLGQHKSYVFTLIQKFHRNNEFYTDRDDLIVITDEAHRAQYGTLALNMRNGLPNASYIGFTGTPLFKDDEITKQVFGGYISKYDFDRAVKDGATVPLYYDSRGDKLGVSSGDLGKLVSKALDEVEIDNIDTDVRLQKEIKRDYHILTASKRLNQIAKDLVRHYSDSWETGKAMLVCIDKVTCVRMHDLVTKHWQDRIDELKVDLPNTTDEQELVYLTRKIKWMEETIAAVVVSEEQGEVEKFRKWDLDITPHRRLIKEGMDLPDSMRAKQEYRSMQRMDVEDAFKAEEHPFRIAIVCAMWLTGFDVPSLSTLYLDKPLKAHTLMQAIARANRVHEGKNNGLIVDYVGILRHLRKALSDYASSDPDGGVKDPTKPDEELLEELAEAIGLVKTFLKDGNAPLEDVIHKKDFEQIAAISACKEVANENDETRKRFEVMCREVFKKFKFCLTKDGVNAFRSDRDAINIIYKTLQRDREEADISAIIRKLHDVVDGAIDVNPETSEDSEPYDISNIDFDRLKEEFKRHTEKKTTVQNLRDSVEQKLHRLLSQNPLRVDLQKHYEKIVEEYNREKDRVTIEQTFEALLKLVQQLGEEESRAVSEGLDEESLAVFDLLKKNELEKKDIKRIKDVACELLENLKTAISGIDRWREKESTRDLIKQKIYDHLWASSTGLPGSYEETEIGVRAEEVYRHVYRAYPIVPSPYYSSPTTAA